MRFRKPCRYGHANDKSDNDKGICEIASTKTQLDNS